MFLDSEACGHPRSTENDLHGHIAHGNYDSPPCGIDSMSPFFSFPPTPLLIDLCIRYTTSHQSDGILRLGLDPWSLVPNFFQLSSFRISVTKFALWPLYSPTIISRLKAITKVTNPTIVVVITKGFKVAILVIFGIAQSVYRSIYLRQYSLDTGCCPVGQL